MATTPLTLMGPEWDALRVFQKLATAAAATGMPVFQGRTREPGGWESGRQAGGVGRPAGRHSFGPSACLFASRESPPRGGHFPTRRPLKGGFCAESPPERLQPAEEPAASGTGTGCRERDKSHLQRIDPAGAPSARGSAAPPPPLLASSSPGGARRSPTPGPSGPRGERTPGEGSPEGRSPYPEGVLTCRWG